MVVLNIIMADKFTVRQLRDMLLQADLVPVLKEKVKKSEEKLLEAKKQTALDERLRKANQSEMDKKTIEVRDLEKKLILANTEKVTTFFKQSEEIKTLKKRNGDQEQWLKAQSEEIKTLKKRNGDQEQWLKAQDEEIKTLKKRNGDQKQWLNAQNEEIKTLKKRNGDQKTEIDNLQKRAKAQSEETKKRDRDQETMIDSLQKRLKAQSEKDEEEAKKDHAARSLVISRSNTHMMNILFEHVIGTKTMTPEAENAFKSNLTRNYNL